MGNKHSGNPNAHGTRGNKGGTGRPPVPDEDRKTIMKLFSPKLWYKMQAATLLAGEEDWRVWLEQMCDEIIESVEA